MFQTSKLGIAAAVAMLLAASAAPAQQLSDSTLFLKAVKQRDGGKVTSLISAPGSVVVNSRGRDDGEGALHIIVRERDLTWLSFLIGKGARVDLANKDGDTPLALAAQLGWLEGAELLLARRAGVDAANARGETPLIFAVQKRDLPMARLLLAKGANPKRTDSVAGYSALDYARQDRRAAPLLKLLEAPARPQREMAGPTL